MPLLLSIDGGGALGAGPAHFLAGLEKVRGDLHEDILTGSSVGGLLILLRAAGRSWQEIDTVFGQWVGKIFAPAPWWWKVDPTRPKYRPDGFEAAVSELFGDRTCASAVKPFFVTSADMASGRPKIWDRSDRALLRDVALATAAAPTYFPPRSSRFVDGGLVANNPSMIGLSASIGRGLANLQDLRILSLATGGSWWADPRIGPRTTLAGWLKPILGFSIDGNEERDEYCADQILGSRHLRIDPLFPTDLAMDDLGVLDQVRGLWDVAAALRSGAITALLG